MEGDKHVWPVRLAAMIFVAVIEFPILVQYNCKLWELSADRNRATRGALVISARGCACTQPPAGGVMTWLPGNVSAGWEEARSLSTSA